MSASTELQSLIDLLYELELKEKVLDGGDSFHHFVYKKTHEFGAEGYQLGAGQSRTAIFHEDGNYCFKFAESANGIEDCETELKIYEAAEEGVFDEALTECRFMGKLEGIANSIWIYAYERVQIFDDAEFSGWVASAGYSEGDDDCYIEDMVAEDYGWEFSNRFFDFLNDAIDRISQCSKSLDLHSGNVGRRFSDGKVVILDYAGY